MAEMNKINQGDTRTITKFTIAILFLIIVASCSKGGGTNSNPVPPPVATINGTVKDAGGNTYPNTLVKISNGSDSQEAKTQQNGSFIFKPKGTGSYEATIIPPLSATAVTILPVSVNVQANQASTADFVIQPQPVTAHLNFETADLFGEIKDANGNIPSSDNTVIYARNVFDAPVGLLTPIKAPDGHHLILSEWKAAKGDLTVTCNGNTATVKIELAGMIPNGTYTLWCNFLNKKKSVGESISIGGDVAKIEPLGSGTANVVKAGADGKINTSIQHFSCLLTQEVALVVPVIYHLNGKTFGAAHIPDEEEVVHLLAYFQ